MHSHDIIRSINKKQKKNYAEHHFVHKSLNIHSYSFMYS